MKKFSIRKEAQGIFYYRDLKVLTNDIVLNFVSGKIFQRIFFVGCYKDGKSV